jgi:hypothetical protein
MSRARDGCERARDGATPEVVLDGRTDGHVGLLDRDPDATRGLGPVDRCDVERGIVAPGADHLVGHVAHPDALRDPAEVVIDQHAHEVRIPVGVAEHGQHDLLVAEGMGHAPGLDRLGGADLRDPRRRLDAAIALEQGRRRRQPWRRARARPWRPSPA